MKIEKKLRLILQSPLSLLSCSPSGHTTKSRLVLASSILLGFLITIPSSADQPSAARVVNFQGNSNDFWIRSQSSERNTIEVAKGVVMRNGGILSVPTADYWASFGFVGGDDSYDGLIVKTHDRGTYTFPCEIRGNFILGWNGQDNSQRACSAGDDGIVIDRTSDYSLESFTPTQQSLATIAHIRNKQNSNLPLDADLIVEPGSEPTIIRTTSRPFTTYKTEPELVECTPEICTEADGSHIWIENRVAVETERISVDVLEGNIKIQPEDSSISTFVREGERYTYPEQSKSAINLDQESNSCQILRFLNPAYWSSTDAPQNFTSGITSQLQQYREAIGILGHEPTNLSSLEQRIIIELNRARTSPVEYAEWIETQKQNFYSNWLQLRGYSLSSNERKQLVDEAISFIHSQTPLPSLSVSDGMSRGNQDHVIDQGQSGLKRGHTGDNFSGPAQRIGRYGTIGCRRGRADNYENVIYFQSLSAQTVVMEMIIGDNLSQAGYEDAGSRDNLFNPEFQVMGVACGSHAYLKNMCVITYAAGFSEKNDSI